MSSVFISSLIDICAVRRAFGRVRRKDLAPPFSFIIEARRVSRVVVGVVGVLVEVVRDESA